VAVVVGFAVAFGGAAVAEAEVAEVAVVVGFAVA
jgi:hypothetical protein